MASLQGKAQYLYGRMGNRPASNWVYEVNGVRVHGGAVSAADKAGLLKCLRNNWTDTKHRAA